MAPSAISVEEALELLGATGGHGSIDKPEGLIYRVERKGEVDFLCKYVNPDHQTGRYLPEYSGNGYIVNEFVI